MRLIFNKEDLLSTKLKKITNGKTYLELIDLPLDLTSEDEEFLTKIEKLHFEPANDNSQNKELKKYYDNKKGLEQLSLDICETVKNKEFDLYDIIVPSSTKKVLKLLPNLSAEDFNDFKELTAEIIDFYNFMLNFFDKKDLFNLMYSCTEIKDDSTAYVTIGCVDISYQNKNFAQFMGFIANWPKIKFKDLLLTRDPIISGAPIGVFVHEFGHLIHNFLSLDSEERSNLNSEVITKDINAASDKKFSRILPKEKVKQQKEIEKENELKSKNSKVLKNYYNFILSNLEKKYGIKIDTKNKQYLALLSLTRSQNAHENLNLEEEPNIEKREAEVFAEIFVNWYLTPKNERSVFWEITNEYFQDKMYELENYQPEIRQKQENPNLESNFESLNLVEVNETSPLTSASTSNLSTNTI